MEAPKEKEMLEMSEDVVDYNNQPKVWVCDLVSFLTAIMCRDEHEWKVKSNLRYLT